jgi:hypothetical protein
MDHLAFAENPPIDSGINPLMPVLSHTYWLSVHVMKVMLSCYRRDSLASPA